MIRRIKARKAAGRLPIANTSRPVALTSHLIKTLEWLVGQVVL